MGHYLWCQSPGHCRVSFVVALSNKAGSKKIIGKDAHLRETKTALANFEVYPTILIATCVIAFKDEFLRDVGNLDSNIFKIRHGCDKVEVLEVDGAEANTFPGYYTVENELDKFKQGRVGTNIP